MRTSRPTHKILRTTVQTTTAAPRDAGSDSMTNESRSLKTPRSLTRDKWRSWLERNHSKEKEAWLIFYKKHASQGKMSYLEALDDALCYGWIDGRLKRIDDDKHMIRFSPRREASVWSDHNVARVRKLVAEGKMTPAAAEFISHRLYGRFAPMDFHRLSFLAWPSSTAETYSSSLALLTD